jgi:hypothetical protein
MTTKVLNCYLCLYVFILSLYILNLKLIGGGIGTLMYNHIGPLLAHHSELVLPFAVANGLSSMFWYGVLEYKVGLEGMAGSMAALTGEGGAAAGAAWPLNTPLAKTVLRYGVPFGGPAIGVLTAITGGYLYPLFAKAFWSEELQKVFVILSFFFFFPTYMQRYYNVRVF